MTDTLKPCPFCGNTPELPDGFGTTQYEIECDCGMSSSVVQICDLMTIEERSDDGSYNQATYSYSQQYIDRAKIYAIDKWNTRK